MQKSILVVDSKKENIDFLSANLTNEGYRVITAENGSQALEFINQLPDLIILDIALPDMNGLDIIRQLKRNEATSAIPIIVLTSKGTDADEIISLEVGSDDFILKPVQIQRLLARIRALLRQREKIQPTLKDEDVVSINGLEIRIPDYTISYGNNTFVLPRKEFELLSLLISKPDKVFTRDDIFNAVWGDNVIVGDRTIDVHIRKLREKIGDKYIRTIKGIGYKYIE